MKKHLILLLAALVLLPAGLLAQNDLKVMSYNIRVGTAKDGTNSWEFRYPASALMIQDQQPDIFGVQEAQDGKKKGEFMSIFYNTKKIKVLKWGTFWLSETPEVPSKGWDAACFRSATWALLKDKASGKKFFYVNTHLDHVGWDARRNGLALIVDRIASINPNHYPMVLTGDFNMEAGRDEFAPLKAKMKDARETAVTTDRRPTYNGWGKAEETIDYIWYSGFSSCTMFEVITKPYLERTFVSDHYPIQATLIF